MKVSAENRHLRQAANRYRQCPFRSAESDDPGDKDSFPLTKN